MVKEVELNEGFKALVSSILDNKEASKKLLNAFVEVVNDRASITRLNLDDLKARAIEDVKREFVTKDFVRAEIAEVRQEIVEVKEQLRAEIAEVKDELKTDLAKTKVELLKWIVGLQLTMGGLIIAVIKFTL